MLLDKHFLICVAVGSVAVATPADAASAANLECSSSVVAAAQPGCPESSGDGETTKLHLKPGELPRDGRSWGAGLIEEVIEVDVFVAGGGAAGTSAAIAAARSGARTVIVDGKFHCDALEQLISGFLVVPN
jgi:hypothetical protein